MAKSEYWLWDEVKSLKSLVWVMGLSHRVTQLDNQVEDSGVIAALQIAMLSLDDPKADYHMSKEGVQDCTRH